MAKRKSWKEKLYNVKGLPKVQVITDAQRKRWGEGTIVIPKPVEVMELMVSVPEGKLITINNIRDILARKYKATIACPITTGIFASIAAHASVAGEIKKGIVVPYWRTLKLNGELNEKYPGGFSFLIQNLEGEGHLIVKKGKRYYVKDYENFLVAA